MYKINRLSFFIYLSAIKSDVYGVYAEKKPKLDTNRQDAKRINTEILSAQCSPSQEIKNIYFLFVQDEALELESLLFNIEKMHKWRNGYKVLPENGENFPAKVLPISD